MPLRIAIVAEGPTDVAVVENVISGLTTAADNMFSHVTGSYTPDEISNWSQVMAYCKSSEFRDLAQSDFVDLIVVQIDTDQFDSKWFDLPTHEDGVEITAARKHELARGILISWIGPDIFAGARANVVFAICVDSIECWLLPLFFDSRPAIRSRTKNCLSALKRHEEARQLTKTYNEYKDLSSLYVKTSVLRKCAVMNFSLGKFAIEFDSQPRLRRDSL